MLYRRIGKRCLDLLLAAPAMVILSPILLTLAALVRLKLGSPVLFSMERPGLNGQPFMVFKFRTMKNAVDGHGRLLPDDQRLTSFGRMLRDLSLDELPGLYHVLKGEMSLVGPRPLRMEFLEWYTPDQMRRHDVLPGISGWAQINGRNSIGWERKLELDVWYVEHQSFWLDVKIIILTIPRVIWRTNVEYPENATLTDFLKNRVHVDVEHGGKR